MTLLKGDDSIKKPMATKAQPPGLTIADGWRFGIGFGMAITLALPVILFVLFILGAILIMIFGGLAGELL